MIVNKCTKPIFEAFKLKMDLVFKGIDFIYEESEPDLPKVFKKHINEVSVELINNDLHENNNQDCLDLSYINLLCISVNNLIIKFIKEMNKDSDSFYAVTDPIIFLDLQKNDPEFLDNYTVTTTLNLNVSGKVFYYERLTVCFVGEEIYIYESPLVKNQVTIKKAV